MQFKTRALGLPPEGQGFQLQHCQAATVWPLDKALNTLLWGCRIMSNPEL